MLLSNKKFPQPSPSFTSSNTPLCARLRDKPHQSHKDTSKGSLKRCDQPNPKMTLYRRLIVEERRWTPSRSQHPSAQVRADAWPYQTIRRPARTQVRKENKLDTLLRQSTRVHGSVRKYSSLLKHSSCCMRNGKNSSTTQYKTCQAMEGIISKICGHHDRSKTDDSPKINAKELVDMMELLRRHKLAKKK